MNEHYYNHQIVDEVDVDDYLNEYKRERKKEAAISTLKDIWITSRDRQRFIKYLFYIIVFSNICFYFLN